MKATQYAESSQLKVVGYYQASERVDETSLAPVGERVAETLKAKFPDAIAFVVRYSILLYSGAASCLLIDR